MKHNATNVLFYGCWPPPYGGIASHLYELLPALADRNVNVFLIVNEERGEIRYTYEKGVHIYYYSHLDLFKKNFLTVFFYFFYFIRKKKDLKIREFLIQLSHFVFLKEIISTKKIDFLFTHDNPRMLVIPFVKAKFPSIKIFTTIYADFIINKDKYTSIKSHLIECFKFSNLILSCSQFCVNTGKKFLNIDYPTKVIYNNVNPEIFTPLNDKQLIRKKIGIPVDSIVLITMCKMNTDMGVGFLLDVHQEILKTNPTVVIFFVGAYDELSERIVELSSKNNRVFHAFNIPGDMKPYYFAAADIFTAPTIGSHACMGIANIEAMMSGLPVLSSNSGGHRETIEDGHDGFIVPLIENMIDESQYLERLKVLVENSELRNEIGIRTRQRALNLFSNEKIVDIHLEIINDNFKDNSIKN